MKEGMGAKKKVGERTNERSRENGGAERRKKLGIICKKKKKKINF